VSLVFQIDPTNTTSNTELASLRRRIAEAPISTSSSASHSTSSRATSSPSCAAVNTTGAKPSSAWLGTSPT